MVESLITGENGNLAKAKHTEGQSDTYTQSSVT